MQPLSGSNTNDDVRCAKEMLGVRVTTHTLSHHIPSCMNQEATESGQLHFLAGNIPVLSLACLALPGRVGRRASAIQHQRFVGATVRACSSVFEQSV